MNRRIPILEILNSLFPPAEERLYIHLFETVQPDMCDDERIMYAYILSNTPLGRLLLKRAKFLRPSLIVQGEAMDVHAIVSTMGYASALAEMFEDDEFGQNPSVRHWKTYGGLAVDSDFEQLIEMAKRLERKRSLSRPERERFRVIRKTLEKEREMERYAMQRHDAIYIKA